MVKKIDRKCGPEFGGLLWHRLTPHRKPQYRCTTTIHRVHNSPKDVLKKLLSVWLLVRTNFFIPSRFGTTDTNFDTCYLHYVAICGEKFIWFHIYILGAKLGLLQWIFLKIPQQSIRSGAHNLFSRFSEFSHFDRHFSEFLAPPSNENENCVGLLLLKELSLLKKIPKLCPNQPVNGNAMLVRTMFPLTDSAPALRKKKLETKASSHQRQCIPAGYCHAHMPLYVNGKYKVYEVHNYVDEFLRFGIFPPHISDSCGAIYRRNCNMYSALQSIPGPLTNSENSVQIHA